MGISNEPATLEVTQIVASALASLPKFLGRTPEGVRVEEVLPPAELHGDDWRVTLSHLEPGDNVPEDPILKALSPLSAAFRKPPAPERVLRVIVVSAKTGQPIAMTRREPH